MMTCKWEDREVRSVNSLREFTWHCICFADAAQLLVAMRRGDTPVPIPNTLVKTTAADNTWLVTAREDRWLPDLKKKN